MKQLNIRVPDAVFDEVKVRAAEHGQSVQDYVTSLISRDIETERAAAARFVAEVLERDGHWLDELEGR
ncbi:hypothetical protein GCM10029978_036360 [Actinoallomurus acanthiterrae]